MCVRFVGKQIVKEKTTYPNIVFSVIDMTPKMELMIINPNAYAPAAGHAVEDSKVTFY